MKITVLMHQNDPDVHHYLIGALADRWMEQGHQIEVLHGLARPTTGDIVFLHVDLTVIPDEYLRFVADHPCVVGRSMPDISKTLITRIRVFSPYEWDGPVIVKTVRNHGGHPERQKRRGTILGRMRNLVQKATRVSLGFAEYLDPQAYPIFDSARRVPRRVFSNPALLVERFVPERLGDLYCRRLYTFVGDASVTEVKSATTPLIVGSSVVECRTISPSDEIVARRREFGLDFGKLDYVIHKGQTVLLDANRTPGFTRSSERARARVDALAPGLASLLCQGRDRQLGSW